MGDYSTQHNSEAAAWEWLSETAPAEPGMVPANDWLPTGGDGDVAQAVTTVINMIPSLVRAIANEEITSPEQAEVWLEGQLPDTATSGEAWPAIIGAIASAIPAIIPVVRNIVNSARGRRSSRTSRSQPTPRAPAGTRRVCQCRNVPIRQGESAMDETFFDDDAQAEAAGAAALLTQLAPILIQVLPALIPLLTELLRTGLPAMTQAIQTMTGPKAPIASTPSKREAWAEDTAGEEFEGEPIFLP